MLLDRDELTSGSTFHSAGLVGQLRGERVADPDDDVLASSSTGRSTAAGWSAAGSASPARPSASRRCCARSPGRRPSACRSSCIEPRARRSALFPLMVTDGVRCASYLATDGYLDPSQLTYALADGRPRGRRADLHPHPRHRHRRRRRAGARRADRVGTDRGRGRRQRGRHVRGRDRPAGRRARPGRPVRARVPGHPAVPRARRAGEHLPTLRDPDLLVYFREEGGGPGDGRLRARTARRGRSTSTRSTASPPDFNGRLLEEDWPRFEEITENSRRRVPAMDDVKVTRLINGPEAFTPDNEFCLGETEVARLLRRRRLLRPRPRRRRAASAR